MTKCMRSAVVGFVVILCLSMASSGTAEKADHVPTIELDEEARFGGTLEALLGQIQDVAVAPDGRVFVLDSGFDTVHAFSRDGRQLGQFGREGEAPGEFYSPMAIATTNEGGIVIAGRSSVVTVFKKDWTPATGFRRHQANDVRSIAVGNNDVLYVSSFNVIDQTVIHSYDLETGTYLRSFGKSYAVGQDIDVRQEDIEAGGYLRCTSEGLWYLQLNPFLLQLYSWEGHLLREIQGRNSESLRTRDADHDDDGTTFYLPRSRASGLASMGDTSLVTGFCVGIGEDDPRTYVDVYDARDGSLLATKTYDGFYRLVGMDQQRGLHVLEMENEEPVVVRKRVSF